MTPRATSTQLMVGHQLSKGSIIKILHEGGATMRRQSLTADQVEQVVQWYAKARSLAWIGNRLDVADGTVRRALIKCGVQRRDSHGRERA